MMRVVQGYMTLLTVIMSSLLLQSTSVSSRRYPHQPPVNLHLIPPQPDDLHQYPDGDLPASWQDATDLQQYLPQEVAASPQDNTLQKYLQGIHHGLPSILQDGETTQQYPYGVTYHDSDSWWLPLGEEQRYPAAPHTTPNAHQNTLDVYDSEEDHPNSLSANQKANEARDNVGDTYLNLSEGEESGEGEDGVMVSPTAPCWHHLSPEPTWCPSILFQVLGHRPSPLAWRSPSTSPGHPPALHWLRKPPSKRYLGIELPDYIATSYSSIKTDNAHYLTKLHQLKQRMRNAGK